MLERECMLTRGIAYRRVAISIQATFHLGQPHQPMELKSRIKATEQIEGEAPLVELCKCGHGQSRHGIGEAACGDCECRAYEPSEAVLVSLERDVTLDNPNLARVHHDMPIRLQEKMPPRTLIMDPVIPGEPPQAATDPYPEFKNTDLRYDKTQYPEGPAPVDRDVSEKKAAELGVKGGMGLRERKK